MAKNDKPQYEFKTEHGYHLSDEDIRRQLHPGHTLNLRSKTSIYVNDDSIRLIHNNYFAKMSRQGDIYFGWKAKASHTFFKTKDGRLLVAARHYSQRPGDYKGTVTNVIPGHFFTHHPYLGGGYGMQFVQTPLGLEVNEHQQFFRDAFLRVFGTFITQPMANTWGDNLFSSFSNPRQLAEYLFGKNRVRKDLVKAVAALDGSSINHLTFAALFRDLVPIDWIVTFLRNVATARRGLIQQYEGRINRVYEHQLINFSPHLYLPTSEHGKELRRVILSIDPKNYRRMLTGNAPNTQTMTDVFMQAPMLRHIRTDYSRNRWGQIASGRIRNVIELHDGMGDAMRHRMARDNHQYPRAINGEWDAVPSYANSEIVDVKDRDDELWLSLKDAEFDGYKVILPTKSSDLEEWGDYMHNCIGSYRHVINHKDRILGAITEKDKIVACFEIQNNSMRQLLGRFNAALPTKTRAIMEDAFVQRGVNVDFYTGQMG